MVDRKGSSPGKETPRQSSDRPFFVALGILGGIYVVLIVAMLLADVAYLAIDRRVKIADVDFQWDDSGRLIQHGDRISNEYDRLGLTITSHARENPPTIFEYIPDATGREPSRLPAPVLGIGQADNDSPDTVLPFAAPGNQLVFQWAAPVQLTMVDLAHLPAAPGMILRLLDAEGKTLQVRHVDESESQASMVLQIGDTPSAGISNVSRLVIDMPRGGFVARLKYLWIGRQLAPWEKDHPVLSRIVYNPLTEALRKPEIRYSIKLSLISCTITAFLSLWVAIPIGYLLSRYRFPGRNLIDAIVDIPIVLPPLVVGLSLLILFQFIPRTLHDLVVYEIPAVILAQFMVAAAFAVRTMRATFDQIDSRREQVALTLGCSRFQAFSQVVLPEARRGILTAGTLAWARALGEFGPLLIFAGATRMKTEVLSTTIFLEMNVGDTAAAVAVSLIMVTGAMTVLIIARVWGTRGSV
ncbi:MAG: ABC transporter permease [Pirellulaceae bacterium]